jgi:hypothetical protein
MPLDEWERAHVTARTPEGVPLLKCPRCWVELRAGHKVAIRSVPSSLAGKLSAGQEGVVLASGLDGQVRASFGAIEAEMHRDELFYVVGQPPVA